METFQSPQTKPETVGSNPPENKEEKRKGGFWASLSFKLGLGGDEFGAAGAGLSGGLLATKAGVVALVLAGTTVAAGIGVLGRNMMGASSSRGGDGLFSFFGAAAKRGRAGGAAAGPAEGGVSSSLDYLAQANKPAPEAAAPGAQDGAAPPSASSGESGAKAAPDNANAPANVGSPNIPGGKPKLAAKPGFGGAGGSISGGGGLGPAVAARPPDGDAAMRPGAKAGVGAFARNMASEPGGRRAAVGRGGLHKAFQQALEANRTGRGAVGNRSAGMQSAGTTFDGGAGAVGPSAGLPAGGAGQGGAGADGKVKPSNVVQRNDVPQPPPVKDQADVTPYQWAMYAGIGALAAALGAYLIMGIFKKKAAASLKIAMAGGPLAAPAYADFLANLGYARIAAGVATLAGAVATAMGVILMTTYGQMMQGMIFTGIGAIVTAMSAIEWMNLGEPDDSGKLKEAIGKSTGPLDNSILSKLQPSAAHLGVDMPAAAPAMPAPPPAPAPTPPAATPPAGSSGGSAAVDPPVGSSWGDGGGASNVG